MAENNHVHFSHDVLARENSKVSAIDWRKLTVAEKEAELESVWSDEAYGVEERDFKKKQIFKGWPLLWLAYQSTGVIYGDIGTSPLYVYSSTFSSAPSYDDLLGALSIIIWSLTLIVTIKYVLIVLCADDEGEGGTFAIYTLLARFSEIMKRDPRSYHPIKMERYMNDQLNPGNRRIRNWLERSRFAHAMLKALAVFGVSLIMADGILTPAQSVLGAIQGIEVIRPDLGTSTIVGVSCAIIVLLFMAQPLGIARLASTFAPVVVIWLLCNLTFGIYNLVMHDYTVLKAFSPYFAGAYFVRNGTEGWKSLGGILLCFTGVEALFADLGAFSKRAIQISWLCFTYPCLLLAYIGQAAYISRDPSAYSNPFFNTLPPHMFYPSLVISILAAIVASQALITSTFQLLSQIMHSSYFPHIQMLYTSTKFHGQVYIPMANWLMLIGTVIVTAVYNNTTKLGNAYGVCVILVTFITTNLVTLVALIVWRTHPILVFAVWLPFVTLDGLFLSSALTKIPNGAWFTILLAGILASFFSLWRYGKEKQWASEARESIRLPDLLVPCAAVAASSTPNTTTTSSPGREGGEPEEEANTVPQYRLSRRHGDGGGGGGGSEPLTRIAGLGIFFDKAGTSDHVPQVYHHFVQKLSAQPSVVVFLHLRALGVPHVHEEERYTVARTATRDLYRLTIRHGYNDRVVTPDLGALVYAEVRKAVLRGVSLGSEARARARARTGIPETVVLGITRPGDTGDGDLSAGMSTVTSFAPPSPPIVAMDPAAGSDDQERGPRTLSSRDSANIVARLKTLTDAYESQTLFLVGKEELRISGKTGIGGAIQRGLLGLFLFVRENTRQKVAQLDVPVEKLVEVGFVGMI